MLGDFVTRTLVLVLGYAYPAFECFKIVEMNRPEIDRLQFWCQYWIIIAMLTAFERLCDPFVSWLPLYGELKLAFLIYLWHPKTMGTRYIYETALKPYIASHEMDIDRKLQEFKAKSGDMFFFFLQRIIDRGQSMVFEILQFLAARSPSATQEGRERQIPPPPPPPPPPPAMAIRSKTSEPTLSFGAGQPTGGTKTEEILRPARRSFRRSRPQQ